MSQNIAADFPLSSLDKLDIRFHPFLLERPREQIGNVPIRVQPSECDKLPHKAQFPELPDVIAHLAFAQSRSFPVERRGQIVCQPLLGVHRMDAVCEFACLREDRLFRLHPQQVGVRCEADSAVDGALGATLVAVEALTRARRVPVPEREGLESVFALSSADGSGVGEVRGAGDEVGDFA